MLCRALWPEVNLAVITNDIYTHEDAEFLSAARCCRRADRRRPDRRLPAHGHPRRRQRQPQRRSPTSSSQFPGLELVIVESGGDNLTAVFSPELADRFIFVIDVAEGDKIPRKGGRAFATATCWSSTRSTWPRTSGPTWT